MFAVFVQVVSFDVVDVGYYFEEVFETADSEPLSGNFDAMGFETTYFIHNMGSMLPIMIILTPALIATGLFLRCCGCASTTCAEIGEKLLALQRWNGAITTVKESYGWTVLCTFIGLSMLA